MRLDDAFGNGQTQARPGALQYSLMPSAVLCLVFKPLPTSTRPGN
jgi:hypothetical protein